MNARFCHLQGWEELTQIYLPDSALFFQLPKCLLWAQREKLGGLTYLVTPGLLGGPFNKCYFSTGCWVQLSVPEGSEDTGARLSLGYVL